MGAAPRDAPLLTLKPAAIKFRSGSHKLPPQIPKGSFIHKEVSTPKLNSDTLPVTLNNNEISHEPSGVRQLLAGLVRLRL